MSETKNNSHLLDSSLAETDISNQTNAFNTSLQMFDPLQTPARLPSPRRLMTLHSNDNHIDKLSIDTNLNDLIQLNPTPPSSPGKRIKHTSIASLINKDLSEFDPLMTNTNQETSLKLNPTINITPWTTNAIDDPSNDLLVFSPLLPMNTLDAQITTKMCQPNTQNNLLLPIQTNETQKHHVVKPLKKRRPSEQLILKERKNSTSTNFISAQGVISQPAVDLLCDSPPNSATPLDKLHNKLQTLVDVHTPIEILDDLDYMNSKFALNKYKDYLSPYEKTEILKHSQIYFVGEKAAKIIANINEPDQNYGYDDEKGDYQIKMRDHLNYRYEILESLGKGSFGQVVKCYDHSRNNAAVAVKIIRNKKRFHAQAQTEIKILEELNIWDPHNKSNNVRMLDYFYFREHICIVFECLSLNLYEVLQQNNFQGFSIGLVKRFASQIISAVKLLGDHDVIHCDIKPENILLKQVDRSGIRLIDFGSSCHVNEKVYTYIQSRFYRAPEIILGLEYGLPIDMWSIGCVLVELYTGQPLFPGETEADQLACIMQLLGVPKKEYLDRCSRKKQFFDLYDHPRKSINSKGIKRKPNSLTFKDVLKIVDVDNFDKEFIDFIRGCLTWEPERRLTPTQALNHPWIKPMRK